MRKFVSTSIIILVFCYPSLSQLFDDFSDGEYHADPGWENTSGYFTVDNGMLKLSAPPVSGHDFITVRSDFLPETSWQLNIRYDFNPSGYNYADIYLAADDKNLDDHVFGYFVRVGGQDDGISLNRRNGYPGQVTAITARSGILAGYNSVELKLRVTRDRRGNWQLFCSLPSAAAYTLLGSGQDDLYQRPNFFGILCHYTSTRSSKFYFDDVRITGERLPDSSPPEIDSVYSVRQAGVLCRFNEKADKSNVTDVSHYRINGFIYPDSITYDPAERAVVLKFISGLIDQTGYELMISGIRDLTGNTTGTLRKNFTYHEIHEAYSGSIIINEIMPDPEPSAGLPEYEYVELLNQSDRYIDLSGCCLNRKRIGERVMMPGEYAILCPANALNSFSGSDAPVLGISNWDIINNSGEELILTDREGKILDKVDYSPDWFEDNIKNEGGWSLELINSRYRCWGRKAWKASTAPAGGTPGYSNSVYAGTVENHSKGYWDYTSNGKSLKVEFSDPVISTDLKSNFSIENNSILSVFPVMDDPAAVMINLRDSLRAGLPHLLTIHSLNDCSSSYRIDTTIRTGTGIMPGFLDILITEIMAKEKPSRGLPETEYIELYNPGGNIIDLSGSIFIVGNDTILLPARNVMPGEFRTLCPSRYERGFLGHAIGLTSFPLIHNDGENFIIKNKSGQWVYQLDYNKSWIEGNIEGGLSIEMIDTRNPCGKEGNWKLSDNSTGGTPGKMNSVSSPNPDNMGPLMENVSAAGKDRIWIRFSEPVSPETLVTSNFSINESSIIDSFTPVDLQNIICKLNADLSPEYSYVLHVRNVTDCSGNLIRENNSEEFGIPRRADSLDIVINEVLFNPFPAGVDYIEIYNRSEKFIDLFQWTFSGGLQNDHDRSSPFSVIPFIIKPGAIAAFTTGKSRTINDYPGGDPDNIFQLAKLPAMNNDHGSVSLIDAYGKIMDHFDYDESFHNRLLTDYEGVSLERIQPDSPSNDPHNWQSASEHSGFGTPGKRNSCALSDPVRAGNIYVDPGIFTPGNSITAGHTNIYYSFTKPGFVANIRIFNIHGRPVRYLANNVLLSTSGFFSWDGLTENGVPVHAGYYLISFNVYHPDGTRRTFLDKVAVATHF